MFSTFRNTTLAAIVAGLALTSPARATWLVNYALPSSTGSEAHVQFDIPTFLTSDSTSIFTLNAGTLAPITTFQYNLTGSGTCSVDGSIASAPCDGFIALLSFLNGLSSTSDPDVFTDTAGGTLTFTNLAAAPEPASLTLLALGLAGLGMVLRTRRA
jgi:hypothetical protein